MARRCLVCGDPRRAEVDAALRRPHSIRQLARDLDVTRQAIMRHRQNHVSGAYVADDTQWVPQDFPDWQDVPDPAPAAAPAPPPPAQAAPVAPPPKPPKPASPQDAFLTSYAAGGDIKESLKAAGITRPTLRKWQEHDEAFVLRFHQAETEAIEALEAEARIRAVAGSRMVRRVFRQGLLYEEIHEYRPSDAMLVKLLQAHKPDKYGDKLTVTQTTVVKAIDAEAWESV